MKNHSAKLAQYPQLDGSSTKSGVRWRSMKSAPRDGQFYCFRMVAMAFSALRWSVEHDAWISYNRRLYFDNQLQGWAPIPEWTGEVTD